MNIKYLQPADDYCICKSLSEAKKIFESYDCFGKVALAMVLLENEGEPPKFRIGPKLPQQIRSVHWICYNGIHGISVIPAFEIPQYGDYYADATVKVLMEVPDNSMFALGEDIFCYKYETAYIEGELLEDWTIFSIAYIDSEEMAKRVALVYGKKPLSATLNKCFLINDGYEHAELKKSETYVMTIWNIKYEDNSYQTFPAFFEDSWLISELGFKNLNWEAIEPEKGFTRNNKYYRVAESSDNGYYFYEGMFQPFAAPQKEPPP